MDPQAFTGSELEAQCAIHPGQSFTSVCSRCGSYMCRVCTEGGRFEICAACRARTGALGVALRRDQWTLDAVMRHAYAAYTHNAGSMTVGIVIMFGVISLFNGVTSFAPLLFNDATWIMAISVGMLIPQMLVQGVLTLGILSMAVSAARGERVELAQLFGQGRRLGGWILQTLILYLPLIPFFGLGGVLAFMFDLEMSNPTMWIAFAVFTVLAMPPLIYFFMGLVFANTELVAQPHVGAVAAVRNSFRLAAGQRWMIMLCGLIAGVLLFAGMLACFVGVLFTGGYAAVMFATLYLALRNGADDLEGAA